MNEFQQKVFDYLTSGEGSKAERSTALILLVKENFFEERSGHRNVECLMCRQDLAKIIKTWRTNKTFCDAEIDRFEAAILPKEDPSVSVVLELAMLVPPSIVKKFGGYKPDFMPDDAGFSVACVKALLDAGLITRGGYTRNSKYMSGDGGSGSVIHQKAGDHITEFTLKGVR